MSTLPFKPWKPISSPRKIALLGKLIEELSEIQHRAARALIQGFDETDPDEDATNADLLGDEFADGLAVMRVADIELSLHISDMRIQSKEQRLIAWLDSLE